MTEQDQQKTDALNALEWPLRLTRLGMVAERATRAFWPFWSVIMLAVALLMLGFQDFTAPRVAMGVMAVFGIAAIWSLVFGLRLFRWPDADEAVVRLDNTLPGHPITQLKDTQVIGTQDPASKAVWQAHLTQMATRVRGAKAAPADLRVSSRDPYALRFVAALALLVALLFGSLTKVASVGEIATGQGGTTLAAGPSWEGWIEPPVYTGKPSLYLNDLPEGDLSVPNGARITLRLYGKVGALSVQETLSGSGAATDPAAIAQEFTVTQDGTLSIDGQGGAQWQIAILPDMPPEVRIDGDLKREAQGVMYQQFAANDDYGVVSGTAKFQLDLPAIQRRYGLATAPEPRDPLILDLPMPITGTRSAFTEELVDNLSEHPWVGLPVTLTLAVEDAAGQSGQSTPMQLDLPGRRFFAPLARAVIEQRRDLLWSRDNGARVSQVLRAVTHRPEGFVRNNGAYLMLRVALTRLDAAVAFDMTTDTRDEIAAALWEIALVFEDGSLADAKERLHRAQERLAEAMKNGASKDEIAELMQELRDATKEYMRQLAEQQRQDGSQDQQQQAQSGEQMEISQAELQALMDRIQELMEEGRMEEAQELMERMNEMMENMEMAEGGEGGEKSQGEQSMEDLKDTLRGQQGLSDQAFRDLQEQFNPNANRGQSGQNRGEAGGQGEGRSHEGQGDQGQGENGGESGEQGGGKTGAGKEGLANQQQALRDELQRQKDGLPGAGTPEGDAARDALDRADQAMKGAEDALRGDRLAEALDNQAEAMEALREGMRNLGEAIAKNEQQQQSPGQQGEAQGRDNANARDPLGRDNNGSGKIGTEGDLSQGDDVYRRARELLDELRRRTGDKQRPELELEYLERLLDRF